MLGQLDDKGISHPIIFESRSLNDRESRYGATELEGLALVWSVGKFKPYLYGSKTIVLTDHAALKALVTKADLILTQFDLTIVPLGDVPDTV